MLKGLLPFDRSRLATDLLAGITLAALGIPEVMGYTKIIGTPVITGLYTLLIPVVVFAVFGSSRHLVVSADSATAAIVAAGLATASLAAGTPRYVALTSVVALVAAAMLLTARLLKLGFLSDFLSRTVLVGFLSGVGIQVAFGELPGLLGLPHQGHGFVRQLVSVFRRLPESSTGCLLISMGVLAVIAGFDAFAPRFPGALLAVAGAIAASAWFHWGVHGIGVLGEIPGGLPHIGLPALSREDILLVLPTAFSCFVVILAQSAATSRAYALKSREACDPNADLVGLSLANAAAGCSGTFVVNGSPTKTAMVDTAGGRSQVAHLATASVVLIVLLFLTRPLGYLPAAVLSAIVFMIGIKLVDIRGLKEIARRAPKEFGLALLTAAIVVFVGVEEGILLAVVLSLLQHVRHGYRPHTAVILHDTADHWRMEEVAPGKMIEPGMVMYWFGADLFYANSGFFTEQARRLVDESPTPVRWLAIDGSPINDVDYSAGKALIDLQAQLEKRGVSLVLARVNPDRQKDWAELGLVDLIGADHVFHSRQACVEAYRREVGQHQTP